MISHRLLKTWAVLLGVVFFGATTLFALLGVPSSITGGQALAGWLDPVIAGAILALSVSPLSFVICAIKPGIEVGRAFDETRCPECDYDLTGLESDRCPECGRVVDRDESRDSPSREGSSAGGRGVQ